MNLIALKSVVLIAMLHGVVFAASEDAAWLARVEKARVEVASRAELDVKAGPVLAAQSALFALSVEFPMHTDWLMQDLPQRAWEVLVPATREAAERELAGRLGIEPGDGVLGRYLDACAKRRHERIGAVLDRWAPFAFTEAATFQMSFIGYTEGLSDARHERFFRPGSRLTVLDFIDGSTVGTPRVLIDDPHGVMRDVDVSMNRDRLLFAWKKSDRLDDYHIYEYDLIDESVKQLTTGIGRADYEPCYLPDGDIIFASTRPEQSVPCWWTEISNLYRMDGEGRFIRRLAIDQVHTLYPQVLSNGRVCYTRWDYNDRGQNFPHPVFAMNPDGKAQRVFYGGNSWFPTSLLHTRAIPGSHKVMSIAAGHHTRQHGKLVVVDTTEGRDEGAGLHFISPPREVAYERVDRAMQGGDQFRYPYPLSEEELLVSYQPDYGFRVNKKFNDSNHYGLYWMHADGRRELLHWSLGIGVLRPVPLGDRPQPPVIPDTVDYAKKTGTYYVHDVYRGVGLAGIERGEAKKIRVVKLNYRAAGVGKTNNRGEGGGSINSAPVALANGTWDIKEIVGDADIHADGSALFEVPAMESIYLQVLDGRGRVLQTSRTWDTLRPGEQKSCAGCHDKSVATFEGFGTGPSEALKHGVQSLDPFYGPERGFSFAREVQPILDAKCVSCHDGSDEKVMALTGEPVDEGNLNQRLWSRAYINLTGAERDKDRNWIGKKPEEGLVRWISKMSRPTELPPKFAGAVTSPLLKLLDDGHYGVTLSDEEYHKLAAWIDLLVPFCGTYREAGDWSQKDHAYYGYFEGKRGEQAREESNAIAAYVESLGGPAAKVEPAAAFTRATYRPLFTEDDFVRDGDLWRLKDGHREALVDRIERAGAVGEVAMVRGGHPVGVMAEGDDGVALRDPIRSADLRIRSGGDVPAVTVHGLLVSELPEVDGYQRHLEYVK